MTNIKPIQALLIGVAAFAFSACQPTTTAEAPASPVKPAKPANVASKSATMVLWAGTYAAELSDITTGIGSRASAMGDVTDAAAMVALCNEAETFTVSAIVNEATTASGAASGWLPMLLAYDSAFVSCGAGDFDSAIDHLHEATTLAQAITAELDALG